MSPSRRWTWPCSDRFGAFRRRPDNTGEAVGALKELKLEAKDLARLAPDQQFEAIAEAMRGVKIQGDRVRLAMKLFDSEGIALLNTLALGFEGFAEIKRRLEAYGVAVDQMDVQKVQDANDAFAELSPIQKGFYQQLAIQLSPALREFSGRLTAATIDAGGMKNAVEGMTEPLRDPETLDMLLDWTAALKTFAGGGLPTRPGGRAISHKDGRAAAGPRIPPDSIDGQRRRAGHRLFQVANFCPKLTEDAPKLI